MSNAAGLPGPLLKDAEKEVVRLYRDIGVELEWHQPGRRTRAERGHDPRHSHPVRDRRTPAASQGRDGRGASH